MSRVKGQRRTERIDFKTEIDRMCRVKRQRGTERID